MNNILWDFIMEGVMVVYLDDILIFTKTIEEHWRVTCHVLRLLQGQKLFLKLDKCEFKTKVEYLRVIISHNSIEMDPAKVAGVVEWPTPTNKKEVQSFLKFTNFYCWFIQDFSHHAQLLFDLTWNDVKWQWTSEEQSAFDSLKTAVTSTPILASLDNPCPFCIEATAPTSWLELSYPSNPQKAESGTQWLSSPNLFPVEQNYKIHDKEMLAIIWAMEEWWQFLEGAEHQFEVWTNHKSLEYFMTAKKLNHRQAR